MATDFVAGWFGGCSGIVVGHPFDTVKVRVQTQSVGTQGRYHGVFHCFHKTISTEGPRGLYKGMLSPLVFSAGINAIVFGVTHNMNRHFSSRSSHGGVLPLRYHFLSGLSAGALQSVISGPSELIKTRMQVDGQGVRGLQKAQYRSPFHCAQVIRRQLGLRGLLIGTWTTCLRDAPGFGFYFLSYEMVCRQFAANASGGHVPTWVLLSAGGVAGIGGWLFTYPIDVVKSRLQAQSLDPRKREYTGVLECFRKSYAEGGLKVFTRGLGTALVRAIPVNAVTFYAVEVFLLLLNTPSKISMPATPKAVASASR